MRSEAPPPPTGCAFCSYVAKAATPGAPGRARSEAPAAASLPSTGDLFSDSAPPPAQASRRRGA